MLLLDLVLETVNIINNQPETIVAKEKMEAATAYVVEKTCPSQVHNAYGYMFDGTCAPSQKTVELTEKDFEIVVE